MEITSGFGGWGSIPPTNSVTLAQLVERLTFNQVVMGSSPICDNILRYSVVFASGECVGVTRSNYSPVAT